MKVGQGSVTNKQAKYNKKKKNCVDLTDFCVVGPQIPFDTDHFWEKEYQVKPVYDL